MLIISYDQIYFNWFLWNKKSFKIFMQNLTRDAPQDGCLKLKYVGRHNYSLIKTGYAVVFLYLL
jgi:hypothetical protein